MFSEENRYEFLGIPDDYECCFSQSHGRDMVWHFVQVPFSEWMLTNDVLIATKSRAPFLLDSRGMKPPWKLHVPESLPVNEWPQYVYNGLLSKIANYSFGSKLVAGPMENSIWESYSEHHFSVASIDHYNLGSCIWIYTMRVNYSLEPLFTFTRMKARGPDSEKIESYFQLTRNIKVRESNGASILRKFDDSLSAPSNLFMEMHEKGIDANKLTKENIFQLIRDMNKTSPEEWGMGHAISRVNINLWRCLCGNSILPNEYFENSLAEANRVALDFPDNFTDHIILAALQGKTLLKVKLQSGVDDTDYDAFEKCIVHLSNTDSEYIVNRPMLLAMLVSWIVGLFSECRNSKQTSKAIDDLSRLQFSSDEIIDQIEQSLGMFHELDTTQDLDNKLANIRGIIRCEVAQKIVSNYPRQGISAEEYKQTVENGFAVQVCMDYQARFYDLSVEEVNDHLTEEFLSKGERSLLFLRPLSVTRSVYLDNGFSDNAPDGRIKRERKTRFSQLSLEGAIRHATKNVFDATNAVGGMRDVIGMVRSLSFTPAGVVDLMWRKLVLSYMDTAHTIIVLPDSSGGVQWEIDQIFSRNHIEKTIFIQLPSYLDWDDKANKIVFSKRFPEFHYNKMGCFVKGDPNLRSTNNISWEGLWNGELANMCENIL